MPLNSIWDKFNINPVNCKNLTKKKFFRKKYKILSEKSIGKSQCQKKCALKTPDDFFLHLVGFGDMTVDELFC